MAPPVQPPTLSNPYQAAPGYVAQQPEQAAAPYVPQLPFPADPGFIYAALVATMASNNEVLLACLLALTAVVALLAIAIIFVYVMSRREAASQDREQTMQLVVQNAIRDAYEQAESETAESGTADVEYAEKEDEDENEGEVQAGFIIDPDESSPGSDCYINPENSTLLASKRKKVQDIPTWLTALLVFIFGSFILCTILRLTELWLRQCMQYIETSHSRPFGRRPDEEEASEGTPLLKKSNKGVEGKFGRKVSFSINDTAV
ncbi:hypothetical protein FGRMN_5992 [Fusarium graminum]|nr:hypothetical protein FGRMN_5992 [Fusarium graminum]